MRKFTTATVFAILAVLFVSVVVYASDINVLIEGQKVIFTDQSPVIVEGRTLVPVRDVFEVLGFEVDWDSNTRTAIISNTEYEIRITIDRADFTTNGVSHTLDVPAQIIGGRTMIPIRLPLESIGFYVDWDSNARTVLISESPIPEISNVPDNYQVTGGLVWAVPPTLEHERINTLWGMFFDSEYREIDSTSGMLTGENVYFNGCGDPPPHVVDPVLNLFGDPAYYRYGLHGGIGMFPLNEMTARFPGTVGRYLVVQRVDSTLRIWCEYEDGAWFLDTNAYMGTFAVMFEGEFITDFIFDRAVQIDGNRAFVRYNGRYGILDMRATAINIR